MTRRQVALITMALELFQKHVYGQLTCIVGDECHPRELVEFGNPATHNPTALDVPTILRQEFHVRVTFYLVIEPRHDSGKLGTAHLVSGNKYMRQQFKQ